MIDIVSLNNNRKPYPTNILLNNTYRPYLKMAEKMICKVCPSLLNEDNISNIATAIMFGDWKWDGRGTKSGYRMKCAKWAILNMIRRFSKAKSIQSLNQHINSEYELGDIIEDKKPNNTLLLQDVLDKMFLLKNRQQKCILMKYLDSMTLEEIADKIGISKQAVHQNIINGLKKLKRLIK